jgi:hypothetical protein
MPATYEPIATQTLGSVATAITFSSIPATYTDLQLVLVSRVVSTGNATIVTINGDTGTNYSFQRVNGDGSTTTSSNIPNYPGIRLNIGSSTTSSSLYILNAFSYTSSIFKTFLWQGSEDLNGSGNVIAGIDCWRNTATITSMTITTSTNNFAIGTTATLYGIKAA